MSIQTLTGNELESGSAIDNSQTDQFSVLGPDNTIVEDGGNLIVKGYNSAVYGLDTGTTIMLGTNTISPTANMGVTDQITLNGSGNSLIGLAPLLDGSKVTFTVSGLGSSAGGNTVSLDNSTGTTTISLAGIDNVVMLNGDATNSVTTGAGGAAITIGSSDDNLFGWASTVNLAGSGNTVTGGDENFTVSGGVSNNTISLGDGENTVTLSGTHNAITVWGGDNVITAGGSGATVSILGVDGLDASTYTPDSDDGPVPPSPTDDVTIAGAGDSVTGTYENVDVLGLGVTSAATVTLGNGNNILILRGTGGNTVTLGNGGNSINASGSGSTYTVGDGANAITLSGTTGKNPNGNTINVIDATGVGKDIVQLALGQNNTVNLGMAGGSVTGSATGGTTTVTQSGTNAVTVNLNNGPLANATGDITLGNGNDTVTANGPASTITVGNGNDTITANGAGTSVTAGNGNDTITANGSPATVTAGNGNDSINANGNGATVTAGTGNDSIWADGNNATVTVGTVLGPNGNVFLQALGNGDMLTVNASAGSVDTVQMGGSLASPDKLDITSGRDNVTINGPGDTVNANAMQGGSVVTALANDTTLNMGSNSSASIHLNPAAKGDVISVQSLTSTPGYTGHINVSGFGLGDTLDLQGLGFTGSGATLFAEVIKDMTFGPTYDTLNLAGGGTVNFLMPTAFSASEFMQSSSSGPVGPVHHLV